VRVPGGAFARLVALLAHTVLGALIAALAPAHALTDTRTGTRIVILWHRGLLAILGIRLRVLGQPIEAPALVIANHVSWVDIPALGALCSGHFIAKSEIATWPLMGWLAAQAGTLYIIRGDKRASGQVATRMKEALLRDQSVLLFPEGTSTDGTVVRAFHARLFAPAIDSGCLVQPVAIRYLDRRGVNHPAAPYFGDATLPRHLWGLLCARGEFAVHVDFLAPEVSTGLTARALAERTRTVIASHLGVDP